MCSLLDSCKVVVYVLRLFTKVSHQLNVGLSVGQSVSIYAYIPTWKAS